MFKTLKDIYDYSVCWQMSPHERASFICLIQNLPDKESAVEVGTFCGGTLRHLAETFDFVYALDISFKNNVVKTQNVQYLEGKSQENLETLIHSLNLIEREKSPTFFLIDADHEYEAVLADLAAIMHFVPKKPTILLVHDSWYPPSRKAIQDTVFSPYVSFVDLDFCSGSVLNGRPIGGFALVCMSPTPRDSDSVLEIRSSESSAYNALLKGA